MVVEKWEGKPYRLVVQRQRRTDNMQEIWEGEYTYKCILTKDFKSDIRDIVEFYNLSGGKERIFDEMNNGFGWKRLPKSFMSENTVCLLMTTLVRNFYKTIIQKINAKDFGLSVTSRIKTLSSNTFPLPPNGSKHPEPTDSISTLKILLMQGPSIRAITNF